MLWSYRKGTPDFYYFSTFFCQNTQMKFNKEMISFCEEKGLELAFLL